MAVLRRGRAFVKVAMVHVADVKTHTKHTFFVKSWSMRLTYFLWGPGQNLGFAKKIQQYFQWV